MFVVIPQSISKKLAWLTSKKDALREQQIDKIYPDHAQALKKAGLVKDDFPTFDELWATNQNQQEETWSKKKKKFGQNTFFCVRIFKFWGAKIHKMIKTLQDAFSLSWLWVRMLYHWFTNLHELLHGDLDEKLNADIFLKDFENKQCNFNMQSTGNDGCPYNGQCRQYCVIYKVNCKDCGKIYIGQTQQSLKDRMTAHF